MNVSHMHTGEKYKDDIPVPRRMYRCRATASEVSPHNKDVMRKHVCKITVDHADNHKCVCGKSWPAVTA